MSIVEGLSTRLLEKAVSVSLKPSQYIGWEIGTTALCNGNGAQRVALVWPQPYHLAMTDSLLLEIYDTLKATGLYIPERFFLPSEDLGKELERLGLNSRVPFSLESKRPLDDFDLFIIKKPIAEADLKMIQEIAHKKSQTPFLVPEEVVSSEFLWKKWNLARNKTKQAIEVPLVAFNSGDNPRLQCPSSSIRSDNRITRYRLRLKRWSWARFISHLEQIQLIKNVLFLSGLPLVRSSSKRQKLILSFGPAVSVSWASESEFFDVDLFGSLNIDEVTMALKGFWPPGYEVVQIQRIPRHFPSLEASANWAEFLIEAPAAIDMEPLMKYVRLIKENKAPDYIVRKEKSGDKVDLIDLRSVIGECLELETHSTERRCLLLALRFGSKRNLKPEKILETLLHLDPKVIAQEILLTRMALAWESQGGHKRYLCPK